MYSVIVQSNACTFQVFCMINDKVKVETKDILEGYNQKKKKSPCIHFEVFSCFE